MSGEHSRRSLLRLGAGLCTTMGFAGCTLGTQTTTDGSLFVYNPYRNEQQVHVKVVRGPEGNSERIVDGVYHVPSGDTLEFDGVLEGGQQYRISARPPDDPPADALRTLVDTCDGEGSSGRTSVRVYVARDSVSMTTFSCEKEFYRRDNVEYLDASEYKVENTASNTSVRE